MEGWNEDEMGGCEQERNKPLEVGTQLMSPVSGESEFG